jgi:hypothetical protein
MAEDGSSYRRCQVPNRLATHPPDPARPHPQRQVPDTPPRQPAPAHPARAHRGGTQPHQVRTPYQLSAVPSSRAALALPAISLTSGRATPSPSASTRPRVTCGPRRGASSPSRPSGELVFLGVSSSVGGIPARTFAKYPRTTAELDHPYRTDELTTDHDRPGVLVKVIASPTTHAR